jgi:NitT/TauT family transport system ATP-binding protein
VLAGIDLVVVPGETTALVGSSGCGKSTLLELVGGSIPVDAGRIAVGGETAAPARTRNCAWMPQSDMLLPWKDAADNAAIALRLAGGERAESRSRAAAALTRLGLGGFTDSYPAELSGGMRQRVAFARTLLADTPALLLDEPFAALDAITRAELQETFARVLRDEGRTTLLVTHDVEEALYMASRVAILSPRPGRIRATIDSPATVPGAPRARAVTRPEFVAARELALEALSEAVAA